MPPMSETEEDASQGTQPQVGPRTEEVPTEAEQEDAAQTAPAASTAYTVFKPKEPKFGGLVQVGHDTWAAWTGGKPKADFTQLLVKVPCFHHFGETYL